MQSWQKYFFFMKKFIVGKHLVCFCKLVNVYFMLLKYWLCGENTCLFLSLKVLHELLFHKVKQKNKQKFFQF